MRDEQVGLIGAGQMAEAIARGILAAKLYAAASVQVSDPDEGRRRVFDSLGVRATSDNPAVVRSCNVLIIAVKPQSLSEVLPEIGPSLTSDHLLISICAGCPTRIFEQAARADVRVVRVMPNLPARVGRGAAALCGGKRATPADLDLAAGIFASVGKVVTVEERLMDAVTALSGSGPAYFYFLVEVMIEAGQREGLSEDVARELAIQTARGAAEMMAVTDASPEELRRRVTSKGGTTEAAFKRMQQLRVREGILEGIATAVRRAEELGDWDIGKPGD